MAPGVQPTYRRSLVDFFTHYLGTDGAITSFGGRADQLAALTSWLNDGSSPPSLLLTGPAGRGKSSLLVHWIDGLDPRLAVVFVPVSIRFGTNSAAAFYTILAGKLAAIAGKVLPPVTEDVAGTLREICFDLLDDLQGIKDVLIVVDGLDEAVGWEADQRLLQPNRSGIRILVSARPLIGEPEHKTGEQWLERLGWNRCDVIVLDLPLLTQEGVVDVLATAGLGEARDSANILATELMRLSAGDPLLLQYLVDDLRRSPGTPDAAELSKRTAGFDAYFRRWLGQQKPLWEDGARDLSETLEALLALLSCALGPLRHEDLDALLRQAHALTGGLLEPRLRALERFVLRVEGGFVLSHPRLGEHLRLQVFRSGRLIEQSQRALIDWGKGHIAQLEASLGTSVEAPPYVLQFHLQHLIASSSEAQPFMALADLGWLKAWEAFEGGLHGFATQLRTATAEAQKRATKTDPRDGWLLQAEVILHSIRNAANIPPELVAACVEKGVLSVNQALNRLDLADTEDRVRGFMTLLSYIPEEERGRYLDDCLLTARGIHDYRSRVTSLAAVVRRIPLGSARDAVENELIEEIRKAGSMAFWWTSMEQIAPVATGPRVGWLVENALLQVRREDDWRYLHAVFPSLAREELDWAIEEAAFHQGSVNPERASSQELEGNALAVLFRYLRPAEQRRRWAAALAAAGAMKDKWQKSASLASIYAAVPIGERKRVAVEVLKAARVADGTRHGIVHCLADVARAIDGPVGEEALSEAVSMVLDELRGETFSRLSPLVPLVSGRLLDRCFDIAIAARFRSARAQALSELAPKLTADQLTQALQKLPQFDGDETYIRVAELALSAQLTGSDPDSLFGTLEIDPDDPQSRGYGAMLLATLPTNFWLLIPRFDALFDKFHKETAPWFFRKGGALPEPYRLKLFERAVGVAHRDTAIAPLLPYLDEDEALLAFESLRSGLRTPHLAGINLVTLAQLMPKLPELQRSMVVDLSLAQVEGLQPLELARLTKYLAPWLDLETAGRIQRLALERVIEEPRVGPDAIAAVLQFADDRALLLEKARTTAEEPYFYNLTGLAELFEAANIEERPLVKGWFFAALLRQTNGALSALVDLHTLSDELKLGIIQNIQSLSRQSSRTSFLLLIAKFSETIAAHEGDAGLQTVLRGLRTISARFP